MWCTCICLRSHIMSQCKVNIKYFITLRLCVKRITQDHIASNPDAFLYSETKWGLTKLFNEDEDKDLIFKIGIAIIFFGALLRLEELLIEIKDIAIDELVNVECPHKTKLRTKGFSRFKTMIG